jgi:hypothetical protein
MIFFFIASLSLTRKGVSASPVDHAQSAAIRQ